ncbi:unnamed protein product [Schistosoma margrebowiei]|uniref:Protein kinase domain-containing protein n=1 Tax=Schistosoma margrebowiei TaxID=48269 RepID=A0A3P8BRB0_9TREM|nr:unnamed protein product [Schistosoma margrebowiei]
MYFVFNSGKFGEVKRCQEKKTGREFAAKFVPIASEEDMNSILNEIAVMNKLRHPRLIQLYDAYQIDEEVTLVLELITGGELFERIIDESFNLNESRCIKFMHEILQGVEYMHSQNVIHLDLKPENILCLSATSFKTKIIDFGLARFYQDQNLCVLFGTPEFVSPEVISYEPVSPAADMWSLGVICYVMDAVLALPILAFISALNPPRSPMMPPKKRMTATECLQHQWLKQKKKTPSRSGTVSKKRLKHFVYRRKWQKAVNAIIALQRMGVVLQHSPIMQSRHPSLSIHGINRSLENETKRPKLPQATGHKLLSSSPTPPPTVSKESSPKLMKKPSGIFRKTSFFGKTRKDDTTTNSTSNNGTKNKNKANENLSDPSTSHKNKLDLSLKLKRKESGKGFVLQRHKNSQQSTSSDSPSIIPKISITSEPNSRSSSKSETVVTIPKQQNDTSTSSSSIFKIQKKNSASKIIQSNVKQSNPFIVKDKKSSTSTSPLPPISTSNSPLTKSIENTTNEKEKLSIGKTKTILNTNDTTNNLISSHSKTTDTTTVNTHHNFHKVPTKSKNATSISKSDIALKINFFSNLSKEGKVK